MSLWSFQGARGELRTTRVCRHKARSLKTQQRTKRTVEVNVYLGELSGLTIVEIIEGLSAYRSNSSGFPRKEVIQPHLPPICHRQSPMSPRLSRWQHRTGVALVAGLNPTSHDTS